jgi:hypothetical protein
MDYMFLVYIDEERRAARTEAERAEQQEQAFTVLDDAVAKGVFRAANPLQPPATAVTARTQNGRVTLTDGPFAETKEFLAGFWIIDCQDLNEAKRWASRLSQSCCGNTVELRQIAALPERAARPNAAKAAQLMNA